MHERLTSDRPCDRLETVSDFRVDRSNRVYPSSAPLPRSSRRTSRPADPGRGRNPLPAAIVVSALIVAGGLGARWWRNHHRAAAEAAHASVAVAETVGTPAAAVFARTTTTHADSVPPPPAADAPDSATATAADAAADAATDAVATDDASTAPVDPGNPPRAILDEHTIQRRETLYDALVAEGVGRVQVAGLVTAAKPFTNLALVRPGMTFSIWRSADVSGFGDPALASFQMALAPNRILVERATKDGFAAEVKEIPYVTKLASYTGEVDSTLWEAAVAAKMDPDLIASLADVFAFDLDFNTEVRQGDRFRLVVEQKLLDGRPAGYGNILAAEYVNQGETHQAFRFENASGDADYYRADGGSLRRLFLRSPLKYRRISSRFSSARFHPILHHTRAHQGVDYAASVGTPIRSVGDGVVERAGWNGGSGNFVKIRHNSTYETSYSHLSRYGAGVKAGVHVKQGQIIGYVGQTGLATGPHLHFAFYVHGRYVDPLSQKFPSADPVPAGQMAAFHTAIGKLGPLLPAWPDDDDGEPKIAGMPVHPAALQPPL